MATQPNHPNVQQAKRSDAMQRSTLHMLLWSLRAECIIRLNSYRSPTTCCCQHRSSCLAAASARVCLVEKACAVSDLQSAMLAVVARSVEKRSTIQAVRSLHTRSAYLVSERDGTGAGGAAKVVVTPAATATIVTPNTQPNTHYTSSIPNTQPVTAAPATSSTPPPPPPPPQPTQQKPVVVPAPPASSSSYSSYTPTRARSSVRSRLTAFLVGVGVAAGAGYYRLQSDVWSSARALEGQIEGLRGSGADSTGVADTVAALERRVAELEKDRGKK